MAFRVVRRTPTWLPLILAAACSDSKPSAVPTAPALTADPHSHGKPAEAHVTNVSLDVDRQIEAWKKGAAASSLTTQGWSSHEGLHLLRGLPETIEKPRLAELDRTFKLSGSGNSEILFAWLEIAIRHRYEPAFPALEHFLASQGRRKFLRPLYTDLAKTDWGKPMAMRIYKKARPTYHSVSVNTIDQILKRPRPPRG